MTTRRDLLGSLAAGLAAGSAVEASANAADAGGQPRAPTPAAGAVPADVSFLATEPLLNLERARDLMARNGVDAIVATDPTNVFYLTNHWPTLDRLGYLDSMVAILPRDAKRPLAIVMQGFLLYYRYADEVALAGRTIFPYQASDSDLVNLRTVDDSMLTARERHRRAVAAAAQPISPGLPAALVKALDHLKLRRAVLATDQAVIQRTLEGAGFDASYRDGEDLLRWVRLQKSPAEIRLMRLAASQNVAAAMAAARAAREVGTTRALRARFFEEAGKLGNRALFMSVNQSSSERYDEPIVEGMAFSIDCVSTFQQYHGDFGRTIFIGEPVARMKQCTSATATAWRELQTRLRPGMPFPEVQRIGREIMKKQNADFTVSFGPHSVGLRHSDHPNASLTNGRSLEGLTLLENMVLSVDCPLRDTGLGGSSHLEDLVLIGRDGATTIHEVPPSVIVV